jgi:hypothetical protein
MRGWDRQTGKLFSYVSPEALVPPDHPVRSSALADAALDRLSVDFGAFNAPAGRLAIAPEKQLRASETHSGCCRCWM